MIEETTPNRERTGCATHYLFATRTPICTTGSTTVALRQHPHRHILKLEMVLGAWMHRKHCVDGSSDRIIRLQCTVLSVQHSTPNTDRALHACGCVSAVFLHLFENKNRCRIYDQTSSWSVILSCPFFATKQPTRWPH